MIRASLIAAVLLPGLAGHDPRVPVNITQPPWSALVLVQVPGSARCSGVLLNSRTILTAAHCLYLPAVRHTVRPESIHVLSGYQRGQFVSHAVAIRYRLVTGWDPLDQGGSRGTDAALVTLGSPLTGTALTLAPDVAGTPAMLGGYEQDRAQILLADTACRVLGLVADRFHRPLRQHSCAATFGTSGAPLLVADETGRWAIAGLQVAGVKGAAGGLAVPSATLAALIASK